MDFLTKIKINKLKEIKSLKKRVPLSVLKKKAMGLKRETRSLERALGERGGIKVIAEIKPKSPSEGKLIKMPIEKIAKLYGASQADAISVLTDKKYFGGAITYLNRVRKLTHQPILRKDFILDEYQVYESYLNHVDAILLIVSLLGSSKLAQLYHVAQGLGMDCLVEVHNLVELKKALKIKPKIIGINNRNLKTLRVDLKTTARLIKFIPKGKIIVSESGINSSNDTQYLKELGVNGVLVGTAILKSKDPLKKIVELQCT